MDSANVSQELPRPSLNVVPHNDSFQNIWQPSLDVDLRFGCYALKVRCAGEDSTASWLRQKGFEVLSPVHVVSLRYSDRIKKVRRALFPGYVFIRMGKEDYLSVVSTNGVSYVVRSGRRFEPLSDLEARTVEAACKGGDECEPCDYLSIGQRVLIEEGLFAGFTGVLTKIKDQNNVVITLHCLHRAFRVATGATALRML